MMITIFKKGDLLYKIKDIFKLKGFEKIYPEFFKDLIICENDVTYNSELETKFPWITDHYICIGHINE